MSTHGELMAMLEAICARANATASSEAPDEGQLQSDLATLTALVDPQRVQRLEGARAALHAGRLARAAQIIEDVASGQLERNKLKAGARRRFTSRADAPAAPLDRLAPELEQIPAAADARRHYEQAQTWLRMCKLERAEDELRQAVQALSGDVPPRVAAALHCHLARVLERQEKYVEAARAYGQYVRLAPDALDLAWVKRHVGRLLADATSGAQGYYQAGTSLFRRGRYDKAAKLFQKAIDTIPPHMAKDLEVLRHDLALALDNQRRKSKAKKYTDAGSEFFKQRQYDKAIKEFQAALQVLPADYPPAKSAFIHYNMGKVWQAQERKAKAAEAYRSYLQGAPDAKDRAEVEALIRDLSRPSAAIPPPFRKP